MPRPFLSRLPWFVLLVSLQATIRAETPVTTATDAIPEALQPWVPWVLTADPDGLDRRACPLDSKTGERLCAWPGRLALDLAHMDGRFTQAWQVFVETWVPLPGDAEVWPQTVQDGGTLLPVIPREGRPAVKLAAGTHLLTGHFQWRQRPDVLAVPAVTGLLSLIIDGESQALPRLESGGRLWLHDPSVSLTDAEDDRLRLEVFRRIEDDQPLRVLTRLELDVSGRAREVRLGPVPLSGGIPFDLQSPLPARLESDGTVRVQVRPGHWALEVATHHSGIVTTLSRGKLLPPWPEYEVWAFAARPDLRQVALTGLTPIDPRQTRIQVDWSRLPVYRIGSDATLTLVEQQRGDPAPEPDHLTLTRDLWLDFDGAGYRVQDHLSGQLMRAWRLESAQSLVLGQVQVAGVAVPINRLASGGAAGVEVRHGQLTLVADGRLDAAPGEIPASGWALAFDSVKTQLHLPPGWELLAVSGVDNLPGTWLARWTLLDLFLVLILVIGIGRLWGWSWGVLALLALGLTWQSPGAPHLIWLHLLAAAALLRRLPSAAESVGMARLRGLVNGYFRLSLLALLLAGLPFMVTEVRNGIYPQLEPAQWSNLDATGGAAPAPALLRSERASQMASDDYAAEVNAPPAYQRKAAMPQAIEIIDPTAQVQTGSGIPDWRWHRFELAWNGPVGQDEQAQLWLLTPRWNLVVALLGSLLLTLLGLRLSGVIPERQGAGTRFGISLALLLVAGLTGLGSGQTQASELPTPELLHELRERLLAPPDCLPDCVDLSRLVLRVEPERLTLELTLDAAVAIAVPVPGGTGGWSPTEVVLNGVRLDQLSRGADQRLRVPLTAGHHQLVLAGPLPAHDEVDIPLTLTPRQVVAQTQGWRIVGLDANGRAGSPLQLARLSEAGSVADQSLTPTALPPLLLVERQLRIGLDWRVETHVRRLSAPEFPILLPVSLLPGESVQTAGLQIEGEQLMVALAPGVTELAWTSSLEPVAMLTLTASTDSRISEAWHLDLSPMWHLEPQGIPPIHQREASDRWQPAWRPRPGETLTLNLTRPVGVPGSTLTFDRVDERIEPGRRGTESELTLSARSSQGGSHVIRLPEGTEPSRFSVDGRSLPVPTGTQIELPLVPGTQQIQIAWRAPQTLGMAFTPTAPDLNSPAVNLNLTVRLPDDRWVLFAAGPQIGPAVLFWGVLVVVAGLSVMLGRNRLTPLRIHDWFLLGIGLSLSQVWVVVLVVGWLFALGLRQRKSDQFGSTPAWRFNLMQVGLILLTVLALGALLGAVQQGLLGHPDMQVMGNGSTGTQLNWYQDQTDPGLPAVWVYSVPMWIYRALMLGWALWLAFRLLDWLRWGWAGFVRPQLWREGRKSAKTV